MKAKVNPSYRGYYIQPSLTGKEFFVQKGGFTLATKRTMQEAEKEIDNLIKLELHRNPVGYYQPRFVRSEDMAELMNLWHLSKVPASGTKWGTYERMQWTAKHFSNEHPYVSQTGVYKDLDAQLASSRFRNPKPNPDEASEAAQGFELFHGKPSTKITEDNIDWPPPLTLERKFGPLDEIPEDVALLGELVAVMYEDDDTLEDEAIEFENPLPFLVSDITAKRQGKENLWITGGDYEVDIWDDFICGPLRWVEYQTVKSFDDFEPTSYKHWFAEPCPVLAHNHDGTQLYILRGDSRFHIDRSSPTSLGIDG